LECFDLDITDLHNVKKISFLEIGQINDIAFYNSNYDSNKYAILATEKEICMLCIQYPTAPTITGRYEIQGGGPGYRTHL
jgi:hypothetical protein